MSLAKNIILWVLSYLLRARYLFAVCLLNSWGNQNKKFPSGDWSLVPLWHLLEQGLSVSLSMHWRMLICSALLTQPAWLPFPVPGCLWAWGLAHRGMYLLYHPWNLRTTWLIQVLQATHWIGLRVYCGKHSLVFPGLTQQVRIRGDLSLLGLYFPQNAGVPGLNRISAL